MSLRATWYSFGRDVHGELGRQLPIPGSYSAEVRPLAVKFADDDQAHDEELANSADDDTNARELCSVRCGHFHSLARTDAGKVLAWGANGEGQLGLAGNSSSDFMVPTPLQALGSLEAQLEGETIIDCDGGRSHSVFVSAPRGRCFMAGKLPVVEPGRHVEAVDDSVRELHLVDGTGNPPQGTVVACHAGESHNLFVTSEGEVWQWFGESATRVIARVGMERPTARLVLGLPKVRKVSCGWHHTLVLTWDGRVFAFGGGCFGQLGLGSCRQCPSPSHVALPVECNSSVVDVAAGFACSLAATEQGWVYAWGSNEKCQLGLGTSVRGTVSPKPVDALAGVRVMQISAGFSHTACITRSGLLYLWGFGSYGQLGFAFSDVKASEALGGGGSVPLSTTGGGVAPLEETSTSAQGDGGSSSVGHSRPWMQVWPRRCVRGPFSQHRCADVQCGAYHTVARCDGEPILRTSAQDTEVLMPPPMIQREVADLADFGRGPGAGLAERSSSVLRPTSAQARGVETFRSISENFWDVAPKRGAEPSPPPEKLHTGAAEYKKWRRALPTMEADLALPSPSFKHPLARPVRDDHAGDAPQCEPHIRMPDSNGVSIWDAVDEAVHRAFADGSVSDTGQALNLARLVRDVSAGHGKGLSPELPGDEMNRGLPPAPCRGLARIECLTPRPFYLPVSDESADVQGAYIHGSPSELLKDFEGDQIAEEEGGPTEGAEADGAEGRMTSFAAMAGLANGAWEDAKGSADQQQGEAEHGTREASELPAPRSPRSPLAFSPFDAELDRGKYPDPGSEPEGSPDDGGTAELGSGATAPCAAPG